MSAPVSIPGEHIGQRGRIRRLPSAGSGNGLDDMAWAPVLEVSPGIVPALLSCLREAGVPAFAAPARPVAARLRDDLGRPGAFRLWVGASAYGTAEAALMDVMPRLTREAAQHADRAWR
jgi:hypothetical protein